MRQQRERLAASNIAVLVVTFENEEYALNYQMETDLDWPVVIDVSRELYGYYGMNKAGFWDLWGPSTWLAYGRELLKGNVPKPARDDIRQRGGDVLIDPEGMVCLHHVGRGPADRPEIEKVLKVVYEHPLSAAQTDFPQQLKN